ncbi:MAG: MBL fold metallo-hydrolase [Clostridia bacterium]|nr:MBL fold metallo-hydrolase [Clostridia bacterium]
MQYTIENDHIARITIPFADIFTSVYIIKTDVGVMLFDTASYDTDVDNYILPVMREMDISESMLKYIFISHDHGDHSGGLKRLLDLFPNVSVISRSAVLEEKYSSDSVIVPSDGDCFMDVLQVVTIPGHTYDSSAIYDKRTNTLITGDCLQLYGVYGSGAWATNVVLPVAYTDALNKIGSMEIETILASHDYHPYGYRAHGREEVKRYISACTEALDFIKRLITDNPTMDDNEIAKAFSSNGLPTLSSEVVKEVRCELAAKS